MVRDAAVVTLTLLMGLLLTLWSQALLGVSQLVDWLALIILYWVIALPTRVGLIYTITSGLVLDLMTTATLGYHALVLVVVCVFGQLISLRMRKMDLLSQCGLVFLIVGLAHFVDTLLATLSGFGQVAPSPLLTAFFSACIWPAVLIALRFLRRSQGMTEW